MKIATLNIDWAKKYKSKSHILQIEYALVELNADILIITESVHLNLPIYNFVYKTTEIPNKDVYEELNYSKYLNGNAAYRVSIYSKYPASKSFRVTDKHTSLAKEFETEFGTIVIYSTIIGTWFNKGPYAKEELHNCINDCMRISQQTKYFCLAGDLNTSFRNEEPEYQMPGIESRKYLKELCKVCKLDLTTQDLEKNIDHIFISKSLKSKLNVVASSFIEKGILSDHQGVMISIQK